jgi:O-antigen/teichoic acid export membrane protein
MGQRRTARQRPSLTVNAFSSWASLAIHVALGFLLTPVVLHYVGKTGYGIWTVLHSLVGYYGLLNLGVRSATTRYVAHGSARREIDRLNEVVATSLAMFLVTGLIAVAVSVGLAQPLARFFKPPPSQHHVFVVMVMVLGASAAVEFLNSLLTSILAAYERYVAVNAISATAYTLRAAAVVLALRAGAGIEALAWATLGMSLLALVAQYIVARTTIPEVRFSLRQASRATLRVLLTYGFATIVVTTVNLMRTRLDSVVIGRWISLAAVAEYGVAAMIVQYLFNLVNTGTGVLTPRFARLDGTGDMVKMRGLFVRSLFVCAFLACGGGMVAVLFGPAFIRFWVGPGFETATPVLWILAAPYVVGLTQNSGYGLMLARDRHRWFAVISTGEAVANVAISIVLAPRLGVIGVAIGTAAPMFVMKAIVQPLYVAPIAGLRIREYLAPLLLPVSVSVGVTAVSIAAGLLTILQTASVALFLILAAGIACAYAGIVLLLSHEQEYARNLVGLAKVLGLRAARTH